MYKTFLIMLESPSFEEKKGLQNLTIKAVLAQFAFEVMYVFFPTVQRQSFFYIFLVVEK